MIAVLSVVQSVFGMGILVFGTPTLLLMGYDFIPTLGYLLPASFAISLLQVLTPGSGRVPVSRYLYLLCLPGIGVGLLLTDSSLLAAWTKILIGVTLMLSAFVRFWSPAQKLFTNMLEKHLPAYHLLMGVIHGLTNLGGALLAILASGTNTDKEAIRYTVAHYYLAFSIIQMLLIATVIGRHDVLMSNLVGAAVSATVFLLVGNRIFARASKPSYDLALTIFMAFYGVVVVLQS
ncbi:MAG: hypothetical protein VCD66_15805 [Alphaproteobacteria bacterium]